MSMVLAALAVFGPIVAYGCWLVHTANVLRRGPR